MPSEPVKNTNGLQKPIHFGLFIVNKNETASKTYRIDTIPNTYPGGVNFDFFNELYHSLFLIEFIN